MIVSYYSLNMLQVFYEISRKKSRNVNYTFKKSGEKTIKMATRQAELQQRKSH